MRKFAENRQSNKQTDSSNTEATLILCGSSGERANILIPQKLPEYLKFWNLKNSMKKIDSYRPICNLSVIDKICQQSIKHI